MFLTFYARSVFRTCLLQIARSILIKDALIFMELRLFSDFGCSTSTNNQFVVVDCIMLLRERGYDLIFIHMFFTRLVMFITLATIVINLQVLFTARF